MVDVSNYGKVPKNKIDLLAFFTFTLNYIDPAIYGIGY